MDSPVFTAWVQHDLIPKRPEQSVVVMDNAPFHKQFPDLYPIEKKWAQIKAFRRKLRCSLDLLFRKPNA